MWSIEYNVQQMECELVSDEGILTQSVCNSYTVQSLLISILKLRHQGPKSKPVVKKFYFLKMILNQHRNYVVKQFYPKLSHSLICIKIPYSKIPNNAPRLPAKILTLLCFEVQQM